MANREREYEEVPDYGVGSGPSSCGICSARKPTEAPKVETKKTESMELKSETSSTKDGVKKSTKRHRKSTKATTETAPAAKPTPKS